MANNQVPLNEFITLQRGFDLPKNDRIEGEVPVVASTGIGGYHNESKVLAPGVVIGRSGSIGGGQYIEDDFWPLNTTLWVKDFKGHNPRFVYYLLKSIDFSIFNVGSGVPTLNRNHLNSILVNELDRSVEDEVAVVLGNLDDKINLIAQTNQTLEQMAQALFKSWFVDFDPVIDNALVAGNNLPEALKHRVEQRNQAQQLPDFKPLPDDIRALFPSEFEQTDDPSIGIAGWIPNSWKLKTIGSLNKINPESWTKKNAPESVKYVDLANAKNGSILDTVDYTFEEAPNRARRVLKQHDIIIGVVRPANRSFAYVNENGLTGSTGFAVVRTLHESYRAFTYLSLTNDDCITEFARIADGAAYPAIKPEDVTNAPCIYSSDEILKKFEELAGKFLLKKATNEKQLPPLAEIRDTLLPKLISGELEVTSNDS